MARVKRLNGGKLTARTSQSQQTEIAIQIDALNRSIRAAKPNTIKIRQPIDAGAITPSRLHAPKPHPGVHTESERAPGRRCDYLGINLGTSVSIF